MKPSLSSTFYLAPSTGIFILLLSVASSLTEESCRHSMQQVWACLAGDGLSSLFFMHQVDLQVWLKHWKGGCSLQEASSPAGDLCSRSNEDLFQLATGHLPYPGKLKSSKLVQSATELTDDERHHFFSDIMSPVSYY